MNDFDGMLRLLELAQADANEYVLFGQSWIAEHGLLTETQAAAFRAAVEKVNGKHQH